LTEATKCRLLNNRRRSYFPKRLRKTFLMLSIGLDEFFFAGGFLFAEIGR